MATQVVNRPSVQNLTAQSKYRIKEVQDSTGLEALKRMSTTRIADTRYLDPLYQSGDMRKVLWASPVVIYTQPKKALGSRIELNEYGYVVVIDIPKEHQSLENGALALPAMSFKFAFSESERKHIITVKNSNKVIVVENFPATNGWYIPETKSGIPQGESVSNENPAARYLYRRDKQYVGPVVRVYDNFGYNRRVVGADVRLVYGYGVAELELTEPKPSSKPTQESKGMLKLLRSLAQAEVSLDKMEGTVNPKLLKPLQEMVRNAKAIKIDSS